MKLRWEAMGGTPGSCVRGPLTGNCKGDWSKTLQKIPQLNYSL